MAGGAPLTAVFDLMIYRDELIAAGSFSRAGAAEAHQIARWDGATWSDLDVGSSASGWLPV